MGKKGINIEDQIFGPTCTVHVKNATNLKNKVKFGTIDPYCEVTFENYTKKTTVVDDTKNPEWNQDLIFPKPTSNVVKVQVKIYHDESIGKDKLLVYGTGTITGYQNLDSHDLEISLIDYKQRATDGKLYIQISGGGLEPEEEDDEEEGLYDGDVEAGGGSTAKKTGKKKKKKSKVTSDVSAAVESAHAKIDQSKLDNKEELFQIRFIIHKARKLVGAVSQPLVRIHMDNKVLRTQSKKGKNPKYNETVVFSVNKSEKDLVKLAMEINVIDSSKPPQYALIGLYACDLSVAWVAKDHNLFYKWFALVNPDEPQEGMTGYVNISIQIIPPGVTAKKQPKMRNEEIDVSHNVFFPPGISLQPGQFVIKLYTGEDFPQMDSSVMAGVKNFFSSGEKPAELVDPYVVVEFAGSKAESAVQYGTFDPMWDQKLIIPGEFPSMAEKIVIKVFDDDDFAVDDLIATELLKMAHVSFSSSDSLLGFMPTFGPAYIPLYGSLREFSEVYDEYAELNFGDEKGIAYRGRLLLEINTRMGEAPEGEKSVSLLKEEEHEGVMSKLRRHKYHLFVSFDNGNMIRETECQVEFEVSIGDYGNKLSPHGGTAPSSTQPCNAVYDGTQYFYMPWGNTKPTVILHSQWEDVQYRVDSLNAMQWMLQYMKDRIDEYNVLVAARAREYVLEAKMNEMLTGLNDNFNDLPLEPPGENSTLLDLQLYNIRMYHIGKKDRDDEDDLYTFVGIDTEKDTVIEMEGKPATHPPLQHTHSASILTARPQNIVETSLAETCKMGILPLSAASEEKAVELDNFIDEVEAMLYGKLKDMPLDCKLKALQSIKEKLKDLCFEPQMGIPDVFVWMMSGDNRIAYTRIPINEIMYSKNEISCGKNCGKTGSFFLTKPRKESVGAHLTLTVWFGKFEDVASTFKPPRGSEITVFAETFEFEHQLMGSWTSKMLTRPNFSDIGGQYDLPKEAFTPPEGWKFDGKWTISIDRSLTVDNEAGLVSFTEEIFEGQTRIPGRNWNTSTTWWSDNKEEEALPKDEMECHEGWKWVGQWHVDHNRAVDQEAWEYALEADLGSYGPVERNYHLSRRKKWTRVRERIEKDTKKCSADVDPSGWEYAKIFSSKFHSKERRLDFARRRCWNRKLVSEIPVPVVFSIVKEDSKKDKDPEIFNTAPRIITKYEDRHINKYQLRAYIYQARGLLGADPSGYSDPYARVIFGNRSGCTRVIKETVSPLWDTTLILDNVEICGLPDDITANPPYIVIEMFDEDVLLHQKHVHHRCSTISTMQFTNHDKLGRVVCKPVIFDTGPYVPTQLSWHAIGGVKRSKGELLAAFELFRIGAMELPMTPPWREKYYSLPFNITPGLQLTRVEILTWGVRNMKDYKMIPVDSPHLEIEVGGETVTVDKIDSVKKHPNFDLPHAFIDVMLPIKEEFLPPLNIRILDNRAFGYTPLVGVSTIKHYGKFRTTYDILEKDSAEAARGLAGTIFTDMLGQNGDGSESVTSSASPEVDVEELSEEVDKQMGKKESVVMVNLLTVKVPLPETEVALTIEPSIKSGSTEKLIANDDDLVRDIRNNPEDLELQDVLLEDDQTAKTATDKPSTVVAEDPEKDKSRKEVRQAVRDQEEPPIDPDDILVSDWWSKYYHCIGTDPRLERLFSERRLPQIKLYDEELEKFHSNFRDLMDVIPLYRPDNDESEDEDNERGEVETQESSIGEFKGSLKVYPITEDIKMEALLAPPRLLFANLPNNQKTDVLVRVYVVAGLDLTPLDFGGNVDPYLYIKCGKTIIDDRDNYQAKQTNPIFGKMFQIRASLPRDSRLQIKVYDHDLIGSNDLIGGTTIDLEDRFLSWKRASCALSQQYIKAKTSTDRWRDILKPTALLRRMCLLKGFPPPVFSGEGDTLAVVVEGKTFIRTKVISGGPLILNKVNPLKDSTASSRRQHLALEVLHLFGVVPEHVETRTLYNDDCPGIPQGRVHLWVDIFPFSSSKIPSPIKIQPRKPQPYVLRVIIYNTMDVILDDTNILGEQMSDIFVKCFMEGMKKEAQETDVHYRSLTGEGNFNFRMIYNFDYIPQEQRIVIRKKKKFYHLEASTEKVDPNFSIQVYDKDVLTRDDILGWAELNLVSLPAPTKTAKECTLAVLTDETAHPRMSLFEKKRIRGFWPVYDDSLGERELTGKVEMELEVLPEEEAAERPAGKAREEPNSNPELEAPNRPDTSFNWFTSPWMVFKVIIWRRYKWKMFIVLLIALGIIFLALFLYSTPEAVNNAIWN